MGLDKKRAIVIGGGITGLTAAYRLINEAEKKKIQLELILLEATDRVGGVIKTEYRDGFIIEHGPDAFISTKPWAKNLCEELGIADKLIGTNPKVRRSFVVRNRKLIPVPEGFYMMAPGAFMPFLKSPIFSWRGKFRIALDLFIPRSSEKEDESVAEFVRRRLGKEAFERMAQPMIGGIYTSDAENLSLKATFPRFLEMENEHGSVIKALISQKRQAAQTSRDTSGPRYSLFLSFEMGMQTLVDTLERKLKDCVRYQSRVQALNKKEVKDRWKVCLDNGEMLDADLLCIALPAGQASKILVNISTELVEKLSQIPYTSSVTVNFAFNSEDISHLLNGMGFVVPVTENYNLIGCSFSSVKFENRCPEKSVLLRAFVGEKNNVNLQDPELTTHVFKDISELLGIKERPLFSIVSEHSQVMAQYLVGHQDLVGGVDALVGRYPHLALAGNGYHGIGIPDCIHSGEQAALRLLKNL